MMTKQRQFGLSIGVALIGVAACSKPDAPSDDLSRDIAMAAAPSLTLAPQAGQTQVVSAAEQSPEAKAAPKPSAPALKPRVTHRTTTPQPVVVASVPAAVEPTPEAVAPAPAQPPAREAQRPVQQQAPRGGYKTEAEVFRDAPFPILP